MRFKLAKRYYINISTDHCEPIFTPLSHQSIDQPFHKTSQVIREYPLKRRYSATHAVTPVYNYSWRSKKKLSRNGARRRRKKMSCLNVCMFFSAIYLPVTFAYSTINSWNVQLSFKAPFHHYRKKKGQDKTRQDRLLRDCYVGFFREQLRALPLLLISPLHPREHCT